VLQLTALRRASGISQAELARRAGLHNSTVSLVESGRLRPYPSQLRKLAMGLDFRGAPEALLDQVEDEL
jgi:transcriptional regulator with XRE-family HTH domain